MYTFNEYYIPERMIEPIKLYIEKGFHPGHFLSGIITNDLAAAVAAADSENMKNIPAFVSFFWNEAPSMCWGSNEIMSDWMRSKAE